ncbi:CMP-N-acetylneuraminate-beta-galactosamide-alpha-2,3-sialyltransferase 2-like [Pungitius pungitius]|uniref:CMP-N-acetylneuraminate-beta-galactosamide- alpha-2,3-sialyltransferase 2-like n=1 Tax=Pungitius pungitius TaxID=134920 RepID=UPI0018885F5E|nr:CMP-N-acetylneuraminate-beta-galactosamide-alpha-2,3-sialyltransferase 2-like [Pungitius pungitius]
MYRLERRRTSKMNNKAHLLVFFMIITGICVFWGDEVLQYVPPQEQRSCSCDQCLFENETFPIQNLSRFPQPLLSTNYNLSEEDFNSWKRLQPGGGSISVYREKVKKIFERIPANPPVEAPRPGRCRTCALVGNSINLLGSHYGPLIDFQDYVIRINKGQTKGFEADVGNRTTHRVMYPNSASQLDNTTHPVLFAFKIQDLQWIIKNLSTQQSGQKSLFNKDLAMVLNPAFMRNIHDVWLKKKGYCPSTGFLALVLVLHICDEVHVFGFGADRNGNWSHYWERLANRRLRTGRHPGNVEYKMIEELTRHNVIKFYKGW